MRRRLLAIAIFLLAGAVMNVAVAWGCAAWADVGTDYTEGISEDGTASLVRWSSNIGTLIYFERNRTATLNRTVRGSRRMVELSPYWLHLDVPSAAYQSGRISMENSLTDARGWPALTMWSEYEWPPWLYGDGTIVIGFSGILFVPAGFAAVAIPLLVGNPSVPILHAMLCAAVLGVLYPTAQVFALALGYRWFFGSHIRAALRRIGYELCPRCGHNLGHLSRACPECGWRPELSS